MGASNEKLFMFCESLRKMFLKLSFWTFALKFNNLVIKFQITGPLYCADSIPLCTSPQGFQSVTHPYVMVCHLTSNEKGDVRLNHLKYHASGEGVFFCIYKKLATNLAFQGFYPGG